MSPIALLIFIAAYFLLLIGIGKWGNKHQDNASFYLGARKSPWYLVAFGMLGASLSGITFVSVPGMVLQSGYSYLQMVVGFSLGYLVVAHVLLPVYYRLQVTSIYQYLGIRLGKYSHQTGSFFFLLSRLLGATVRLYAATLLIWHLVFAPLGFSFYVTASLFLGIIFLYTHSGGIRTLVWTDALQTLFILLALCGLLYESSSQISHFPWNDYPYFEWDWSSKNNFFKWLISGIFITLSMTGLDQDMMQKNLSCKNLSDAQKNMRCYGFSFIPVNLAFLFLGACLVALLSQHGITIPQQGDLLVSTAIENGLFSSGAILLLVLGIVAATCSSSDSAIVSLTTAISIDFLSPTAQNSKTTRHLIHGCVCVCILLLLCLFYLLSDTPILDLLYQLASYTYGPLLGLFAFGLFTSYHLHDRWVPVVCIASPLLCLLLQQLMHNSLGYELLILNGLITFVGLLLIRKR